MNVKREIAALERRIFSEGFHTYLRCHGKVGEQRDEEKISVEYQTARDFLAERSSDEEKQYLSKWEALSDQCLTYAGDYAFQCGIYAAFAQMHQPDAVERFSFKHLVVDGLLTSAGANAHPQYHDWISRSLALSERLQKRKELCWQEHITSIGVYWEQQIYRAAKDAFYLGYRYGLEIIGAVEPLRAVEMIGSILLTEYALGITLPMSLREREHAS